MLYCQFVHHLQLFGATSCHISVHVKAPDGKLFYVFEENVRFIFIIINLM